MKTKININSPLGAQRYEEIEPLRGYSSKVDTPALLEHTQRWLPALLEAHPLLDAGHYHRGADEVDLKMALDAGRVAMARQALRERFTSGAKGFGKHAWTTYGFKHVLEPFYGYCTNGEMIAALLLEGYMIQLQPFGNPLCNVRSSEINFLSKLNQCIDERGISRGNARWK